MTTGRPAGGEMSDLPRGIGRPATGALAEVGITRLDQLPGWSEKELLALHGVGPKAIRVLRAELADRNLAFKESAADAGQSA